MFCNIPSLRPPTVQSSTWSNPHLPHSYSLHGSMDYAFCQTNIFPNTLLDGFSRLVIISAQVSNRNL